MTRGAVLFVVAATAALVAATLRHATIGVAEANASGYEANANGYGPGAAGSSTCPNNVLNPTCGDGGTCVLDEEGCSYNGGFDTRIWDADNTLQGAASGQGPPYNVCMTSDAITAPGDGYLHLSMRSNSRAFCPSDYPLNRPGTPVLSDAGSTQGGPLGGQPYSAGPTLYDASALKSRINVNGIVIEFRMKKSGYPAYPTDGMWGSINCERPSLFGAYNLGGSVAEGNTGVGPCQWAEVQKIGGLPDGGTQFPGMWNGELDFVDGPYGIPNDAGFSVFVNYFSSLYGPDTFGLPFTGATVQISAANTPSFADPRTAFHTYKMVWIPATRVAWYLDGALVNFLNGPNVWSFPAFFGMLVESFPNVFTPSGATMPVPVESLYDYIRMWCPAEAPNCVVGNDGQDDAWPGP